MSSSQRQPATGGAAPAEPSRASAGQPGIRSLWKDRPDGSTVFRHPAPQVLWWAWLVFALINTGYLIADGLSLSTARGIAALLTVTGFMYACTLHARVETDSEGVTVYNPLREHRAPWGAVEGVNLGESVEFACTRPGSAKPKTIYSWALYSSRKARAGARGARSGLGTGRSGFGAGGSGFASGRPGFGAGRPGFGPGYRAAGGSVSSRAPADAVELARQEPSQLMVTELSQRAAQARAAGRGDGALRSSTSWLSVAATAGPVVLLVAAFLAR